MKKEVLLEEWSPVANIQAFVEKSEKNYYFYLWINGLTEDAKIRNCWICNRDKAPESIKEAFEVDDEPPSMPAEFVAHNPNGIEINKESLKIVWFEEGDAAALLSGDKILAVIPNFSGYNGFHGFSAYAKGTGPFAWEMTQAFSKFEAQIKRSMTFWDFFSNKAYWESVNKFHMLSLTPFWGEPEKYYGIDGKKFPPKSVLLGKKENILYAITLGVSMIPMPNVDSEYGDDYRDYRRIELGFACNERHKLLLMAFVSTMSGLADYPWQYLTFFGHGHTVPCNKIEGFDYLLFLNDRLLGTMDSPKYHTFMADKVNLLWLVPITQKEQAFIVENGVDAYLKGKDLSKIHILE